jgi:hypothetical protein
MRASGAAMTQLVREMTSVRPIRLHDTQWDPDILRRMKVRDAVVIRMYDRSP